MSYDLRPLSLAELLDRAFTLYRRHFWLFVGIMALPSIALLCMQIASQSMQGLVGPPEEQPSPEVLIAFVVGLMAAVVIGMLVYWLTYAVALGATTFAVSEIYAGRTPSISASYGATRGRIGRLVWLMFLIAIRFVAVLAVIMIVGGVGAAVSALASPLLSGLLVFVVIVVGFVACAWMFLRYAVAVPAAVLEENTASRSIARSIELTRGNLLRVVVLFGFTVVVTYAALTIFQGPFFIAAVMAGLETRTGFWLNMLGVVCGSIGSAFTGPLAIVAMAVLYYDIRIRKEGLDLELMVAGLSQAAAPTVSPSSSAALPG